MKARLPAAELDAADGVDTAGAIARAAGADAEAGGAGGAADALEESGDAGDAGTGGRIEWADREFERRLEELVGVTPEMQRLETMPGRTQGRDDWGGPAPLNRSLLLTLRFQR